MSKPLIIQCVPTLGGGGAEREVARVCRAMKADGRFDVVACCLMGRGGFADGVENAGVEVVVLNEHKESCHSMMMDLHKFLKERRPDIVHYHMCRWGPIVSRLSGGAAVVSTEHGWNIARSRSGVVFDRVNSIFIDKIVAVSEATRQIQLDRWRIPSRKLITIPNAVEDRDCDVTVDRAAKRAELGLAADATVVATVGRLTTVKAQHIFVEAAAEVLKSQPNCVFLLVGEGERKEELEQMASRLGVSDKVLFPGFRDDVREIIDSVDVMCLSSVSEGLPITILEAMASGKPAVVTNVGGCPEVVIDGETGFVVPKNNSQALADAILRLVSNPELAQKMGQAGLHRVRTEYSESKNLERLYDLYSTLLS